eukprot:TRINITY_DN889_c0_g1_i1.p1 TRINITY_DN889_c0_g1~~TRINITY_DN889_c0_g1_i1.p1  ORF type:complete len:189 (-),score=41.30 TRINITY_DN889_c0_g1_i1:96-638(-)
MEDQKKDWKQAKSLYEFTAVTKTGKEVDLKDYAGKVVIVTNIAALCGYTKSNYDFFNKLYAKYKDEGFEILGFPCNQFMGQAGSEDQIETCSLTYGVDFPVFATTDVNGSKAHPIFKWLKKNTPDKSLLGSFIGWNFEKFVVDRNGKPIKRWNKTFDTKTEASLCKTIDALLAQKADANL